ncbi:Alpha-farnesene synthase [Linum perenne]
MATEDIIRRSANYNPTLWEYGFLQSLPTQYDDHWLHEEKLKEEVKLIFHHTTDLTAKLELVDLTGKLGLAHFFEEEIKEALDFVALTVRDRSFISRENLYLCALSFRLLRQHGYQVSQQENSCFCLDMLKDFVNNKCDEDIKGLVELYEASHLGSEIEDILEEANLFSTRILKSEYLRLCQHDKTLARSVAHALELPIHWRVEWFDVKWHIDTSENKRNVHKALVDLAKVNFNVVQSGLQKDLKQISRWWKDLGLIDKLDFTRDRVVESFLCAVGLTVDPEHNSFRKWLTKVVIMILILDDVYDVYGSVEELEQFTVAIDRWDEKEVVKLPECMKICFQSLRVITHEISNEIEIEKGWDQDQVYPHLQRVWGDFCKAMLVEAKWDRDGHTPSFNEYLRNGVVSSSGTVLAIHAFYLVMRDETTGEIERVLEKDHNNMIHNVCLIIRLCNDLGTSSAEQERGDAKSSIACYMREAGVTEETARLHIKGMIARIWKKINSHHPAIPNLFMDININMARVAHNLYQYGDGFNGGQDHKHYKKQILSLLVHPITL